MNVILSIKPEYVAEIKAGRKCFEFRKTIFKEKVEKVYIYASSPVSKVVGEFQPVDILVAGIRGTGIRGTGTFIHSLYTNKHNTFPQELLSKCSLN